jgi:hypothetical protein
MANAHGARCFVGVSRLASFCAGARKCGFLLRGVAPCCADERKDHRRDAENAERGEGRRRRVGSVCISERAVPVGAGWKGLARVGTPGMPTLADDALARGKPGAAREGMAPGGGSAVHGNLFRDRAFSGIFGHMPLTPALSHGRFRVCARRRCWRPWEREWAGCAHGAPLAKGRQCAAVRAFGGETGFSGGCLGFFRRTRVALCASRARTKSGLGRGGEKV